MDYSECWLQYNRLSDTDRTPILLFCNTKGRIPDNAIRELNRAFLSLYGRSILLTEKEELSGSGSKILLLKAPVLSLKPDGYRVECESGRCSISAINETGLLYGVFALLRNLRLQQVQDFNTWTFREEKEPSNPIRMLNHWDNMDGSIERGYSGNSFFFYRDEILINERTEDYARLISSVGINAVAINNVNVKGAATQLISDRYYEKLKRLSELLGSYGIKLFLSINFASPMELGGLATADPCEEGVRSWWRDKAQELWSNVPGLWGFLVKADSEGRPGPFTYERTHADGANMLAEAVSPYDGLIIWRCFVYNCRQDWRDRKTDRAKAAYDNFMPLDGEFHDNVILQIKNGPMDFQVREPVSPLIGGLKKTNVLLEVQIAQEYTGQQRHVCYLIPWFKDILSFHTCCGDPSDTVSDIISGRTYGNHNCGMTAVCNTGNDYNWTGHDLAAANLYGFGRLAFDTELTSEAIADEWIGLFLGQKEKVSENVHKILLMSWKTYEKYTSPLGIGWMVKPNTHYGPDVDGYEYDRWGTYHRADHKGIGVDRTDSGTGFVRQYPGSLAVMYSDSKTCPEELLLFFHHLSYEYVLSTGKTILQHIYDTHFEGAREAALFLQLWQELKDLIEEEVYLRTLERLLHQSSHAKEWRDVVNSYFYRKSGINDLYGRQLY